MAEVSMAEAFVAEVSMAGACTTGLFPGVGDFGVLDLDMVTTSAIRTKTPQPKRLLFLLSRTLRPLPG
jgi:hypothetical protein